MSEESRARALLYGVALGDALGYPIEFLKMKKITVMHGPQGITEPPDPAIYSDDTQTTMAVAEALIEAGEKDTETIMEAFKQHFVEWYKSPENTRHPGHTVTEAARTLAAGIDWRESGANAKGNGAAIRMAPIGFFYQHEPDKLRDVARAITIATHNEPSAIAASVGAAYGVKLMLDGVALDRLVNMTLEFTQDLSEEWTDALLRIGHVLPWNDEVAAVKHLGAGWIATEAVTISMYCTMRHPNDFEKALQRAVNTDGDSDSLGCITGSLVGTHTGISGIPSDWVDRIENLKTITDLADRLAAKKEKVYGSMG